MSAAAGSALGPRGWPATTFRRRGTRRVTLSLIGLLAVVVPAPPSGAIICKTPPPPNDEEATRRATVVFVGTAMAVDDLGMTTVAVERVLKGPPQPRRVLVQGTTGERGVVTDGDRSFQVGKHYVFYPHPASAVGSGYDDEGGPFKESLCSATHPVSAVGILSESWPSWPWARWGFMGAATLLVARVVVLRRRVRRA